MGVCDNPQPGNVQFNYAQLEYIWETAGGNSQVSPIAAAIAMEESGGNSGATDCDSNGTIDRGLWQINSVHGTQSTYDVMGNARAAVQISNAGADWSAWSAYSSGAYKKYLQTGVAPASTPINGTNATANNTAQLDASIGPFHLPSGWGLVNPFDWFNSIVGGATGSVANAIIGTALQGLIGTILNPILSMIAGVMGVAAGGTMVLFGIIVMVRNTETEQKMEQGLGKAAQQAVGLIAPETKAATMYTGASGAQTKVTSTRKPARQMKVGGRNVRFGSAQVSTEVERMPVTDAINTEARAYQKTQQPKPGGTTPRKRPSSNPRESWSNVPVGNRKNGNS